MANNNWEAPQQKQIKSVDISAVVLKPVFKENPYIRTPTYRKTRSISLKGTNSEVY